MVYKTRWLGLVFALTAACVVLTMLTWMFDVGSAEGATCDVPSASYASIQSAVDDSACDTVNLTAELYAENVDVTRSITIQGLGAVSTSVEGSAFGSVFVIRAGHAVTLSDFAITDGRANNGGAILNEGSDVVVSGCAITNNSARQGGGGIYSAGGFVTLDNSVLSDNSLEGDGLTLGGGVYHASGTMTITDSVIANNSGDRGGGIFVADGQLMISATVLYENNADIGGGILKAQGKIEIVNSEFVSNSATFGGGIANEPGGAIYVAGSTLRGNAARGNGGGIANIGCVDIVNSTLSGNSANWGGGIENRESNISSDAGVLTLTNSTLSGNMADNGGGIYNMKEASVTLANSIIVNSSGGECAGPGAFVSAGHNIDSGVTCNLAAGGDLTGTVPMLGPLGDNGGATWTHALLPGSPAINAGDNAVCAAPPVNGIDQRGVARPQVGTCDIGAFEVIFELPFTTLLPLVLR